MKRFISSIKLSPVIPLLVFLVLALLLITAASQDLMLRPIAKIKFKDAQISAIAITPDGARAYVTNFIDDTVSVIDTKTNNVMTAISVGKGPTDLALSGSRAYVANALSGGVSVIGTATNKVIATIPIGGRPSGIAASDTAVYVANYADDSVSVIDISTNKVVATIKVGNGPLALALTPDGSKLLVANSRSDDVSIIETANNTVMATISVGDRPISIAISGTRAYVVNNYSDNISVIDTNANSVVKTMPIPPVGETPRGDDPRAIAIDAGGNRAYLTNFLAIRRPSGEDVGHGRVSIINFATDEFIDLDPSTPESDGIKIGMYANEGPNGPLAITPDGKYLYVANLINRDGSTNAELWVFDVSSF